MPAVYVGPVDPPGVQVTLHNGMVIVVEFHDDAKAAALITLCGQVDRYTPRAAQVSEVIARFAASDLMPEPEEEEAGHIARIAARCDFAQVRTVVLRYNPEAGEQALAFVLRLCNIPLGVGLSQTTASLFARIAAGRSITLYKYVLASYGAHVLAGSEHEECGVFDVDGEEGATDTDEGGEAILCEENE